MKKGENKSVYEIICNGNICRFILKGGKKDGRRNGKEKGRRK